MSQVVWKLTALAIVVGIGVLVVVQAQRGINQKKDPVADDDRVVASLGDEGSDDSTAEEDEIPSQDEPAFAAGAFDDADDAIPASAKTGAGARRRAAPKAPRVDVLDLDEDGAANDPFATDESDASPRAKTSDARKPTLRLTATEEDEPSADEMESAADSELPAPKRSAAAAALDDEETEPAPRRPIVEAPPKLRPIPGLSRADDAEEDEMPHGRNAISEKKRMSPSLAATESDEADAAADFSASEKQSPEAGEPAVLRSRSAEKKRGSAVAPADPFGDDEETSTGEAPEREAPPTSSARRDKLPVLSPPEESEDEDGPLSVPQTLRPIPIQQPASTDDGDDFPAKGKIEMPERSSAAPSIAIPMPSGTLKSPDSGDEASFSTRSPADSAPAAVAPPDFEKPNLKIEKIAPPTAVLGKPMVYRILVKNAGPNTAWQVVVEDVVPEDVRIDGSIPQAQLEGRRLIWKLGTLEPGQERKISVRVIPQAEGTIGGVATVNFGPPAAGPAGASGPRLKFEVAAPRQATVGSPVELTFHVTNVGRVEATGVVIRDVLPASLRHTESDDLEYAIGALPPGKSHEARLTVTAAQAGRTVNRAVVTADGNVTEEAQAEFEIVGPALTVSRAGPRRLHPGKIGQYVNTVINPGPTSVTSASVVETIPAGMELVEAGDGGRYDAAKRLVIWTIDRLEPQQSKTLHVSLSAQARGAQVSVVRAYDAGGASGETMGTTHVTGVPALTIDVGELPPAVEPGEQVKVPVRIFNRGSDAALNVRASVSLPRGLELVSAKAPVEYKTVAGSDRASGGTASRDASDLPALRFAPLPRLDSRAELNIELTLRARQTGDAPLRIHVQCDQLPEVRREEVLTIARGQE